MSRPACEGCGKIARVNELGLCVECNEDEMSETYGTIGQYEGYLPTKNLKE